MLGSSSERIQIVDEYDNLIGHKERNTLDTEVDIFRATFVWIENSHDQVLLTQRAFTKSHDPGLWNIAVSGTVEEGETYETNALKELAEELGVTGLNLAIKQKFFQPAPRKVFGTVFLLEHDIAVSELTLQEEEIAQAAWVHKDTLVANFERHPEHYVPSMGTFIELFIAENDRHNF